MTDATDDMETAGYRDHAPFCGLNHIDMLNLYYRPTKKEIEFWKTRKGEIIAIKDMKTSHIQNCIVMLESGEGNYSEIINRFKNELMNRKVK